MNHPVPQPTPEQIAVLLDEYFRARYGPETASIGVDGERIVIYLHKHIAWRLPRSLENVTYEIEWRFIGRVTMAT